MRRRRVATAAGVAAALTLGVVLLAPTGAPLAGPSDYGGPYPDTTADAGTSPEPSAPSSTGPPSTDTTTPPAVEPTSTTTTSTTSTTTSTTSTTSTTTSTTVATAVPPLPLGVAPAIVTVGRGGTATITGTCPEWQGLPLGPVTVWEIGDTIVELTTGIVAVTWTYEWRAPEATDVDALQVWCGDPATWRGGYPAELQIRVVYVAQAPTAPGAPPVDSGTGVVLPASR